MDEYYKIAAAYFKEFEPRSSFPNFKSYHWYFWMFSLAVFCFFAYEVFVASIPDAKKPYVQMFVAEAGFLLSCGLIALYRFKHTVRATSEESDLKPIERLSISKRARLEALLDKPAWQFMATAKEIIELRGLEKAHRTATDRGFEELWTKIYDPESKARLLTLITALLSLVVAVFGKNEGFNLIEVLSDDGTWALIKAIAQLIVVIFFASIASYHLFRQILELLPWLISAIFPALHSKQATLDYLIRDLIQYHRMEAFAPPLAVQAPAETLQPSPRREPGLGTLIAAICLALLREPSAPSDNTKAHRLSKTRSPTDRETEHCNAAATRRTK